MENGEIEIYTYICEENIGHFLKEIHQRLFFSRFRHSLMTWGEKFTGAEIDDAFGEFKIDGGMIDSEHLKGLMVAKKEGEE